MTAVAGELVTETFDYDGGRQVFIYVPTARPQVILFAGDGQLLAPWGEFLNQTGDVPPTMVVAAHRVDDEMERLHQYSPSFDEERFAAHGRFLVEDVRAWVSSRFELELTPERTATFGVSASGQLALALGLRHPDLFGSILCASPGAGYQPPGDLQSTVPPHLPGRGNRRTVLPGERGPLGRGASRCRRGRHHDRADWRARRTILARRGAPDGEMGLRTLSRASTEAH